MAIYVAPPLGPAELQAIEKIEEMKRQLRWGVAEPKRWYGNLRRQVFARAVQGSNSIEGYNASLEDVMAAVDSEEPIDADTETVYAIEGYRDAMTYILQLAEDREHLNVDETLIKSLHFMMLKHELKKWPGRYRLGTVYVQREPSLEIVYEGPDHELVPSLMAELVTALKPHDQQPLIAAAMAHLNLVMIHPFKDGNGRMARALHTLVLARESVVAPVFSSIEEYLGRNTEAYYKVLGEVGQGTWHPQNDARPWVRFCLNAHFQQVQTHLWRIREAEALWDRCEQLAAEHELPNRVVGPLSDAARGLRLRNASYRSAVIESTGDEIDVQTASRDLRALVERGLLESRGETKGRLYSGTPVLRQAFAEVRRMKPKREDADLFPSERQLPLELPAAP
jgi:Fic family protein